MSFFEAYQSCSLFGALRYFANIRNTVSLINGPTGCAFYARNAVVNLNGFFESQYKVDIPKIFNIDFKESDVIFGNTEKLLDAIKDIREKYNPEAIFLFNCCVSEIIGSDIDEIVNSFKDVLIIPIHTAGFKGDHKYGMKLASGIICDKLMPVEREHVDDCAVSILGEFDYFNRSTQELTDRLRLIGISKIQHIPGKATLNDIREAASASLNIITCQNASRYMAELMKEKYGIPYIGQSLSLYGVANTFHFYEQIYDFYHIDKDALFAERDNAFNEATKYISCLRGMTAAVIAGTRRALGYSSILKELGLEIVLLFSESDTNYNKRQDFQLYSDNLLLNEHTDRLNEELRKASPDVIFTTLPELVAPEKYLARLSDDFAGFSGTIRMAKYLNEHFVKKQDSPVIFIDN